MENNIHSFEILSVALTPPTEPALDPIWDNLRTAIENQVTKDGIDKNAILDFEIEPDVLKRAVDTIYADVSEFYYWYFNPDDDYGRSQYISGQKATGARYTGADYEAVRKAVAPTVEDNLAEMRAMDDIPQGKDTPGLDEKVTDDLTDYIMNWQDWFYDRKEDEDIDHYYETEAEYADIYTYDDYGDLTNILGNNQYDEVSDIPYLNEP